MSQATQTTVSRSAFIIACIVAAVSLLALLVSVFKPSGTNGEFADIGKVIASVDPTAIALITNDAQFKLFFQDGSPIESCGRGGRDTTEVPAACGIKGTIVNSNTLTIGKLTGSDCDYGNDGPGNYYSWHTRSPYKNKGPCHSSGHPGH